MDVTVTGATGLIGRAVVRGLQARGDRVTVLSRDPEPAHATLGDVDAHAWRPEDEAAPTAALAGRDAVIHLAGENVAQRWSEEARGRILESRRAGTRNLVAGLRAAGDERPPVLVSASAAGYYGARGDEEVDEDAPAGEGFLAEVVVEWEAAAEEAEELGVRVARMRTGIVLDREEGALAQMLTPFRLGVGGPVAGGRQYMPWIHLDDVAGMYLAAVGDERWRGPVNVSAPAPVTNREFSKALGRVLRRPALAPVPAFALKVLYGEMSEIVLTGVRMVPRRAEQLGYAFRHPEVDAALRAALGRE